MKRLAIINDDYQSDLLQLDAQSVAKSVMQTLNDDTNTLKDLLFNDGSALMNIIQSKFIQPASDAYTQNKPNYDASALNTEVTNMSYAVYNNICNIIMTMNVKDLFNYFGITLTLK